MTCAVPCATGSASSPVPLTLNSVRPVNRARRRRQADDGFLEAVLQWFVALPLADVAQDAAWREQQRKLLTAQFGPREVAALGAANPATLAAGPAEAGAAAGGPLAWVQARPLTLPPTLSLTPSAGRPAVSHGVPCCQGRALGVWR